jgi:hypothetical protein
LFATPGRAGKNQQIIVLICRLPSFGPLGGHTLRIRTEPEPGTVFHA